MLLVGMNSSTFAQDRLNTNELQDNKWRFGLSLGLGIGILSGNLTDYFDANVPLIRYGMEVGYKKHQLALNVAGDVFVNHYLLKSLEYNGIQRLAGLKLNYTWGQITYGYAFLDNNKWRITPYIGASMVDVMNAKPQIRFQKTHFNGIGGVSLDYKVGKKRGHKLLVENCIQTRLGVTQVTYQPNLAGWSVIASVSYAISLWDKK